MLSMFRSLGSRETPHRPESERITLPKLEQYEQAVYDEYTRHIPLEQRTLAWHNFIKRIVNCVDAQHPYSLSWDDIERELIALVKELEEYKLSLASTKPRKKISPTLFLPLELKRGNENSQETDANQILQLSDSELATCLTGHISQTLQQTSFVKNIAKLRQGVYPISPSNITTITKHIHEQFYEINIPERVRTMAASIYKGKLPLVIKLAKLELLAKKYL